MNELKKHLLKIIDTEWYKNPWTIYIAKLTDDELNVIIIDDELPVSNYKMNLIDKDVFKVLLLNGDDFNKVKNRELFLPSGWMLEKLENVFDYKVLDVLD